MKIKNFNDFKTHIANHANIKRCIIRCDFNIPSDIEDHTRIYAAKETILAVLAMNIDIVLISHYKRPAIDDIVNPKYSLVNIKDILSKILEVDVDFIKYSIFDIKPTDISSRVALLENLRFYEGETTDDDELGERLAQFGDVFINDAFSVSHRAHASVSSITKFLPSFAGISCSNEIENISKVICNIAHPYTAIIGGSKISSKINILQSISKIADYLIITGAMANTFLASQGVDMKKSLVFEDQFELARDILKNSTAKIILPTDFVASSDINQNGENFAIQDIPDGFGCFDIGRATTNEICAIIKQSKTLLWNGAVGAFEFSNFGTASKIISEEIATQTSEHQLVSVIGGGETIASIDSKTRQKMTFVSTAGGAFLELVAGQDLPALTALE